MSILVGRAAERAILMATLRSKEAELVAVYGRRRVGKTFLVRETFGDAIAFELVGMHGARVREQLRAFTASLASAAGSPSLAPPGSWQEAFAQLIQVLERRLARTRRDKLVVFLDELPWLAARRSGFLPAFEHFWNAWASRRPDLVVVICGSAASFMIREVLHQRGGLHNRVTRSLRLDPFTLKETEAYLRARRAPFDRYQILELYMAMGGVPHYLKHLEPTESAAQNIDRLCFAKDGPLRTELQHLYRALFEKAERHEAVVRALATQRRGMSRQELAGGTDLRTGGGMTKVLTELEESGFVRAQPYLGHARRDALYRLVDPYTLFYLAWIQRHRGRAAGTWLRARLTPAWRAWSGLAFEGVCLEHVRGIERALGIAGIETEVAAWQHRPRGDVEDDEGAQIDLVIDRADRAITLCEMKFSESEYTIDKATAAELEHKRETFRRVTGSRKTLLLTLVTTYGLRENQHSERLGVRAVAMDALFDA